MNKPVDASLRQLRYFAVLTEELHFGRAAARLGISQPSLTRQIQSLEKAVGAPLIERGQRAVALTAAGKAFAELARFTLANHDRSVETARNIAVRHLDSLTIGFESCAAYHDFTEIVRQYMARYPRTRLSSFRMSGPEQAEALIRNQIDAGFMHPPFTEDALLTFDEVAEERFIVALPSSHRLASKRRLACADLANEPFVLYPRALAPGCYDAVQKICRRAGFAPDVVHESNEIAVSLKLIPVVGAVTLFPQCVKQRHAPGVAFRELIGDETTVTCGFLRRAGDIAPAVGRFLKIWRTAKAKQH